MFFILITFPIPPELFMPPLEGGFDGGDTGAGLDLLAMAESFVFVFSCSMVKLFVCFILALGAFSIPISVVPGVMAFALLDTGSGIRGDEFKSGSSGASGVNIVKSLESKDFTSGVVST